MIFEFSSWWDKRCFESYEMACPDSQTPPIEVPGTRRLHFVSGMEKPPEIKGSEIRAAMKLGYKWINNNGRYL